MSKSYEIKTELHYTDLEGNTTEISDVKNEKNSTDKNIRESIFTLPLGYGKVALQVGTVSFVGEEETSIKSGDLILIYGALKDQLKSGESLTEDQKEYAKEHPVAQLVITKDYARQLAKILLGYATTSTEEEFLKRLQED